MVTESDRHLTRTRDWATNVPAAVIQFGVVWFWYPDDVPSAVRPMVATLAALLVLGLLSIFRGLVKRLESDGKLSGWEATALLGFSVALCSAPTIVLLGIRPAPEMPSITLDLAESKQFEWRLDPLSGDTIFYSTVRLVNTSTKHDARVAVESLDAMVIVGDRNFKNAEPPEKTIFVAMNGGDAYIEPKVRVPFAIGGDVDEAIRAQKTAMVFDLKIAFGRNDSDRKPKWRTLKYALMQDGTTKLLDRDGN